VGAYNDVLLTILLILGAILLIVLIVVCIKLVYTADKLNIILNDVEKKLESVNGLFGVMDRITDTVSLLSDGIVNGITNIFEYLFSGRKKNKEKNKEE